MVDSAVNLVGGILRRKRISRWEQNETTTTSFSEINQSVLDTQITMASPNGHMEEDGHSHAPSQTHHHQSRPGNGRQEEMVPTMVEAVNNLRLCPAHVHSGHQQLSSAPRYSQGDISAPGSGSATMTGSSPSRDVPAPSVLDAGDDTIRQSNVGSAQASPTGENSPEALAVLAGEGDVNGDQPDIRSDDNRPLAVESSPVPAQLLPDSSLPPDHPESPHQIAACDSSALLHSHASTRERLSSISQSSTGFRGRSGSGPDLPSISWSSTTNQTATGNQFSADPMEGTLPKSLPTSLSTSSATEDRGSWETSSSPSPGPTSSRSWEMLGGPSSASATSVMTMTTPLSNPDRLSVTLTDLAVTSHPNSSSASVQEGLATAVPYHDSSPTASYPSSRSKTGSRDQNITVSVEDKARERRRLLDKVRSLRAENRRLKARQKCLHCRQRDVALTLLPCRHFVFCEECGSSVHVCPLCHKTILADVRTFWS